MEEKLTITEGLDEKQYHQDEYHSTLFIWPVNIVVYSVIYSSIYPRLNPPTQIALKLLLISEIVSDGSCRTSLYRHDYSISGRLCVHFEVVVTSLSRSTSVHHLCGIDATKRILTESWFCQLMQYFQTVTAALESSKSLRSNWRTSFKAVTIKTNYAERVTSISKKEFFISWSYSAERKNFY